ncbi:hypothetical protein OTU49_004695 [Cherax quadricarinatus]|uniref:Uncharacterized protein n=1 Tax=Cherax quadricarinatus TaxID=27406 RepID=A0AAW0XAV8_CHEQU|nr:uncharacterized protein LOC128694326 [Cherax quadricarinatus]
MKKVVWLVMVVVVHTAPVDQEPVPRTQLLDQQHLTPRPYAFKFIINDEVENVRFAQAAQGDDQGRVRGTYSYVRPDNVLVIVHYTADAEGFHPVIVERPASQFRKNPSGTSTFTMLLPDTEEFSVKLTADQLREYRQQAALREQQAAQQG